MNATPGVLILSALLLSTSCVGGLHVADPFSDAPESAPSPSVPFKAADSYEDALQVWETPEDINAWIAANFAYDMQRALRLGETHKAKDERMSIYTPAEVFDTKTGVCVDLSRFGVETLKQVDPQSDPKYLMIEFDPVQIAGSTLRLHWLVSYKRGGRVFFFADSKRPGHIAGPYDDVLSFIGDYERYRGRRIVAFRELESYQRQRRTEAPKAEAPRAKH
jgi:hypothetical protein